jgi:hemerythrin
MGNDSSTVKWDDGFLLGDEQVDYQHRKLFDLVNSLLSSCDAETDMKKLQDTLDFLVGYAVQHFDDEEALQIRCNFPEYERHKQLHDDFKVTVLELVQRFKETNSPSQLSYDIKKVLIKWLFKHILEEDKKIGKYLQTK